MKKFTQEEAWTYTEACQKFKNYNSLDEYAEDVVICLMYSSWHYSEERARQLVKEDMEYIKKCFDKKTPASICCSDVGYSCG